MRKRKDIHYHIESDEPLTKGSSSIIKWYQCHMMTGDEGEESSPQLSEEVEDVINYIEEGEEEEIDLSASGLSEADQDLVLDILARFADAHQDSVDSLFQNSDEITTEAAPAQELSEEELIASICAPKQSNVDALVKQAEDGKPKTN